MSEPDQPAHTTEPAEAVATAVTAAALSTTGPGARDALPDAAAVAAARSGLPPAVPVDQGG